MTFIQGLPLLVSLLSHYSINKISNNLQKKNCENVIPKSYPCKICEYLIIQYIENQWAFWKKLFLHQSWYRARSKLVFVVSRPDLWMKNLTQSNIHLQIFLIMYNQSTHWEPVVCHLQESVFTATSVKQWPSQSLWSPGWSSGWWIEHNLIFIYIYLSSCVICVITGRALYHYPFLTTTRPDHWASLKPVYVCKTIFAPPLDWTPTPAWVFILAKSKHNFVHPYI